MVSQSAQSIKPYRPSLPLRERARQAFVVEQDELAAKRAAAFSRATDMAAASLIVVCRDRFGVIVDRSEVLTAFVDNAEFVSASVIVESILLSIALRSADAAKLSAPVSRALVSAEPHCPVCGATLSAASFVTTLGDLGELLGEVGCGACDWEPDA